MKKIAFAALAATTLLAAPAFAASDTTTISGDVAAVCTIDGPPDTASLNLTGSGSQSLGNVVVQCNSANGYDASASSANAGVLKDATGTSATTYGYTLDTPYGNLSLASAQTLNQTPGNQQSVDGFNIPVGVVITGASGPAFAGRYQDTITWTITAH